MVTWVCNILDLELYLSSYIHQDFNLDFYTEVQDLSYLENLLNAQSPRYASLNMAICSLIEDYALVGFETLAVEVRIPVFLFCSVRKLDDRIKLQCSI